jgi:hypothetical protein
MAITLHTEPQELPEQTERVVGRHRDEFQKDVDGDILILKHATAVAGWPEQEATKLFHRYVVGADDATDMKGVIRRACTLHRVEADFYKDAKTPAGHMSVKFHVSRKLDKDEKPVTDASLDADGKPTKALADEVNAIKAARKPSAKS